MWWIEQISLWTRDSLKIKILMIFFSSFTLQWFDQSSDLKKKKRKTILMEISTFFWKARFSSFVTFIDDSFKKLAQRSQVCRDYLEISHPKEGFKIEISQI